MCVYMQLDDAHNHLAGRLGRSDRRCSKDATPEHEDAGAGSRPMCVGMCTGFRCRRLLRANFVAHAANRLLRVLAPACELCVGLPFPRLRASRRTQHAGLLTCTHTTHAHGTVQGPRCPHSRLSTKEATRQSLVPICQLSTRSAQATLLASIDAAASSQ